MNRALLLLALAVGFAGCKKEPTANYPDNLYGFIQSQSDLELTFELIACAAQLPDAEGVTRYDVFFRPLDGATNFRCFRTGGTDVDPNNYANYTEMAATSEPVFSGHLRRFPVYDSSAEFWTLVTFERAGRLHICNPIRMKGASNGTAMYTDITVTGDGPEFCWNAQHADNAIHFQVVHTDPTSVPTSTLISGTYTYDTCFTFYELDNVVLNVTDADAVPVLTSGEEYGFLVMSVSEDNWVNEVHTTAFTAP